MTVVGVVIDDLFRVSRVSGVAHIVLVVSRLSGASLTGFFTLSLNGFTSCFYRPSLPQLGISFETEVSRLFLPAVISRDASRCRTLRFDRWDMPFSSRAEKLIFSSLSYSFSRKSFVFSTLLLLCSVA